MIVLSRCEVESALSLEALVPVVAEAFAESARGGSSQFPVVREPIPEHDGIFGVKSGYLRARGVLGLKAGGYWAKNGPRFGLTAHQSVMVLFDPATGRPTALLDANPITLLRTGAAGAVAARALARPDSSRVAVIGAGAQATCRASFQARPTKQETAGARPRAGARVAAEDTVVSKPFGRNPRDGVDQLFRDDPLALRA